MQTVTTILLILHISIVAFQIAGTILYYFAAGRIIGMLDVIESSRKEKIAEIIIWLMVLLYNITLSVLLIFTEFKLWVIICGILISLPVLAWFMFGCVEDILEIINRSNGRGTLY